MKYVLAIVIALLVAACGAEKNDMTGTPESDTTGSVQTEQTSSASATTTGESGGTVSNLSTSDKEFVTSAGMAGLAEVQMGNLAVQKAQSAEVKAFAQRMVTDHSKANEELKQLATVKGIALPAELAGDPQKGLEHLAMLSGTEFDNAYMQHMVADHQNAVALFQKAAAAQDTDLKGFAVRTLPTLEEHLRMATSYGVRR